MITHRNRRLTCDLDRGLQESGSVCEFLRLDERADREAQIEANIHENRFGCQVSDAVIASFCDYSEKRMELIRLDEYHHLRSSRDVKCQILVGRLTIVSL